MPLPRNFLFTEMTAEVLTAGREFDGLVPLDAVRDMYGHPVTIKQDELPTYLANTRAAIEATRSESGELVGLPIDAAGHDKGDGAGWIQGIELVGGNLLRLLPSWTEIGVELISKSIRRFFSPTVDTVNKVILGGSLTNWPASRNKKGHTLLRPIELSANLYTKDLADESLDEKTMNVRRAFYDAMATPDLAEPYICEVFDGYVIVRAGDALYRVDYTEGENGIQFAARADWAEVKQAFVEAAWDTVRGWFGKLTRPAAKPAQSKEGVIEMEITLEKLQELITNTVKGLLPAQPAPQPDPAKPALPADLASLFNIDGLSEAAKAERKKELKTYLDQVRLQADLEYRAELSRLQRETSVTELAQRVVGGTEDAPRGLRGVSVDELRSHLLKMDPDEAKWWGELIESNVKDGLMTFDEIGHGRGVKHLRQVPADYIEALQNVINAGNSVAEFFNLTGIGSPDEYDLSQFKAKEK